MSLSWKFFMVSVFQLVLCLQAILTHLIFGSVFNGDSIQKLSLLLLSPAGWIAKQFQSSCIFFFFIFKFLAYYTLKVFREGLTNWRMTGQLSPRVILVYSCFIIVCLGEAVDGDVEIIQGRISFGPCHALFFVIFIFPLKTLMPHSCFWAYRLSECTCLVTCLLAYQNSRTAFFWITRELCNELLSLTRWYRTLVFPPLVWVFSALTEESHVIKLVWIPQLYPWKECSSN